jgi:uncharacterized protein (DUF1501 family)
MKPTHDVVRLTRRGFVLGGISVAALTAGGPLFGQPRRLERGERILVVVQLSGGNDGLATVLPLEQDAWFRARPTLSRVASGAHTLADAPGLALHPALPQLARMLEGGEATCVHSVGYPQPDRSHFRSLEIWHTATTEQRDGAARPAGWLARLAEEVHTHGGSSPAALHVGRGALPAALVGDAGPAPSIGELEQLRVPGGARRERTLDALYADGNAGDTSEAAFLRRSAREAVALARRLEDGAAGPTTVAWPGDDFAQSLALVARLVRSGLGARVYQVELDGFDTHRGQAVLHQNLMARLDGALAAFQAELAAAGRADDVVTLVFSEFGRRVAENASQGTDHGAAGPVFLVGPRTRGGFVGEVPDLAQLVDGDLPHRVDFRSIYTALERDWLGLSPSSALAAADVLR